ncbi:hypothetical protein RB653_001376 [Dictyostelium firmibasis]|uniref:FNIP repeat-containing protein n=1 Tax=Dictyostelium firmibasis TaxID=79012 RepID=A0AAN7YRE4_9MYCE
MKFLKTIVVLIISLTCLIKINSANTLFKDQNDVAIEIIKHIYGGEEIINPCNYKPDPDTPPIFVCRASHENEPVSQLTVKSITINVFDENPNEVIEISNDLTVFKDVESIDIQGVSIPSETINNLFKFENLKDAIFFKHSNSPSIDEDLVLPKKIETLGFTFFGGLVGRGFFESPTLKVLEIVIPDGDSFKITTDEIPYNDQLQSLKLPLTASSSNHAGITGIHENIISNLRELIQLKLMVFNHQGKRFENPISLPKDNSKLISLELYFEDSVVIPYQEKIINSNDIQFFNLPKINKDIKYLTISGNGLYLDRTIGFTDLSNANDGLEVAIEGNCKFITECIGKPCIKLPSQTKLSLFDTEVDLQKIDLSNVTSLSVLGNTQPQPYPSEINFNSLKKIEIRDSTFYGDIPKSYQQMDKNVLVDIE